MSDLRLRCLTVAALLFATPAVAEVHEYTLDNGLRLFVKQDLRAPVVVSQVWYAVGSSSEYDGVTGISHALEHMMFKGTEDIAPGEFSRIISAEGGQDNAFTGADYTAYFQKLEASRLETSFRLEADRMQNLALPNEEFIKEMEVVKEERRMRTEDNPQRFTQEVAMAAAYQTSGYRIPIIGWMHDLEQMQLEDLRMWYDRYYLPGNALVVVVGAVEPDEVYELARKHFGPVPAGAVPEPVVRPEVEQQGIKRLVVKRPAELPYLLMGYKAPVLTATLDEDSGVEEWEPYALEVLAAILDGGSSARFTRNLVRAQQVAAGASARYNLLARLPTSMLLLTGMPTREHTVEDLEQAMRAEIERLQTEPVSDAELERVKTQVVAENVYERDSVFYQAMLIGMLETVGLPWQLIDEYVDRIQAVTAEQVQAVAEKYLIDDYLTVAELDPQPTGGRPVPTHEGGEHVH